MCTSADDGAGGQPFYTNSTLVSSGQEACQGCTALHIPLSSFPGVIMPLDQSLRHVSPSEPPPPRIQAIAPGAQQHAPRDEHTKQYCSKAMKECASHIEKTAAAATSGSHDDEQKDPEHVLVGDQQNNSSLLTEPLSPKETSHTQDSSTTLSNSCWCWVPVEGTGSIMTLVKPVTDGYT